MFTRKSRDGVKCWCLQKYKIRTNFQIFAELLVELLVVILVLADVVEQFHTLLDEILADHLQNFTLLKCLTGDVERQVLRVDDALDEAEVLWDQFLAVVHDEHPSDVQLNVVAFLAVFEQIERSSAWNEEESSELELAFN